MIEDISNLTDPSVQHEHIIALREAASTKLPALDSSIHRFISRFNLQKDALQNLFEETQKQQIKLGNIVKTQTALQKIVDMLEKDKEYALIIELPVESNFEVYIQTIVQIRSALQVLNKTKFKEASESIVKLMTILSNGEGKMSEYFETIVVRNIEPFPISYFSFVDGDFCVMNDDLKNRITYPMSEEDLKILNTMSKILSQSRNNVYYESYMKNRTTFIQNTLKPLLEKSNDRNIFSGELDILQIPSYQIRSHPIHLFIFTLHYLITRETEIAKRIFEDLYLIPLKLIIKPAFDSLLETLKKVHFETINSHVDILFDLDLLSTLSEVTDVFDIGLQLSSEELLMKPFKKTICSTLENYLQHIEKHDTLMIPNGGDISPLTSNVLLFLGVLNNPIYKTALNFIDRFSLETVATASVNNLICNLISKSKHYQDPVVTQLFLLNNGHFAYDLIQKYGLDQYIAVETLNRIEDMIQKSQEQYIKMTWDIAFAKLSPKESLGEVHKGQNGLIKLNKKQRKIIKHQFKDFLRSFDEIKDKHDKYCIKYTKYMAPILNDVVRKVNTIYEHYWITWKDSNFSKTPEKWIYYVPPTIVQIINQLYSPAPPKKNE